MSIGDDYCLKKPELHACLSNPLLNSVNFLNEIIDCYPDAISFAPGAPFMGFYEDFNIARYINLFIEYLKENKAYTEDRARRLLYQYGPSKGLINDLIAQSLAKDEGITVSEDGIIITVGCQEAILLTVRALCRSQEDILAMVNPCYVGAIGVSNILDINTVSVGEVGSGIDLESLSVMCHTARLEGRRIRALYVAPNFSNPSGNYLDLKTRYQLLGLAEREDFYILEDDAYGFTVINDNMLPCLKSLDTAKRVIYLGTCAKTCLPGVRVGFAVADQIIGDQENKTTLLADELALIKNMVSVNTSPICQAIIGGMLLDNNFSFREISKEKANHYQKNLRCLLESLEQTVLKQGFNNKASKEKVAWNKPQGGLFVRVRLPIPVDENLLHYSAKHYNVLWTPMKQFSLDGTCGNELRLSCSYLKPNEITEGVNRFSLFLDDVL